MFYFSTHFYQHYLITFLICYTVELHSQVQLHEVHWKTSIQSTLTQLWCMVTAV